MAVGAWDRGGSSLHGGYEAEREEGYHRQRHPPRAPLPLPPPQFLNSLLPPNKDIHVKIFRRMWMTPGISLVLKEQKMNQFILKPISIFH